MAKKNEVILDTLKKLLEEVKAHNADYHHVTKKAFIRYVEELITMLSQTRKRYLKYEGKTGSLEKR